MAGAQSHTDIRKLEHITAHISSGVNDGYREDGKRRTPIRAWPLVRHVARYAASKTNLILCMWMNFQIRRGTMVQT